MKRYIPLLERHIVTSCHALLVQGVLRMQQEVEVRPGIITKDAEGRVKCIPIYSRIVSLFTEHNELQYAVPGGLIGVGLTVSRNRICPLTPLPRPSLRPPPRPPARPPLSMGITVLPLNC